MSEHQIIAIGPHDLDRVTTLAWRIWPEAFNGILPAEAIPGMLKEIYAPETLAADITELEYQYWLATSDGLDVGYVSAYLSEGRV